MSTPEEGSIRNSETRKPEIGMNQVVTQQWARPGFQIRKAGKYEEDEILLGRILSEGHASACPGTSNI
jgi:hypothetical protein